MKISLLALVALVSGWVNIVTAQTLEGALEAFGRKDYENALTILRPLAANGNMSAQSYLAFMYKSGLGMAEDDGQALQWYQRAAESGYALAQYSLASMYQSGEGTPQDYVQAHKWYSLAAKNFPDWDKEHFDKAVTGRDTVTMMMTPSQVKEAEVLVRTRRASIFP